MELYDELDDKLTAFIKRQHMFFVATAPLTKNGHVNVSPKGLDSFAILGPNEIAYLDLGGSGIETHAHVVENGRITLMFCAFEGKANILRLFGEGTVYDFNHSEYEALKARFPIDAKARAVITVKLSRIQDSCGWGVPFYEYKGQREQLTRWSDNATEAEWREKRYNRNAESIDGLPGLIRPKNSK